MKFLVITGSLFNQSGGPFLSVLSLVVALLQKGHEVTLIGSKDESSQPDLSASYISLTQRFSNLKAFALRKFGPYNLHFTPSIKKTVYSTQPYDVVLIQGIWQWNLWWGFWYAYRNKITSIISIRGEIVDSKSLAEPKKRLFMPWIKFMLNRVDFIHVLNGREKKVLEEMGIKSKIIIIPNGVFIPKNKAAGKGKNMLFLGRLHPIKNMIPMIEAWGIAKTNDWKLIIAGGGNKEYEKEVIAAAEGDSSIEFIGPVYDEAKKEIFKEANWFVLPSLNEGMPMAVLEAMSYGIPVIISPPCNLKEVIEEGAGLSTGLSAKEIAQSFEKATSMSKEERQIMSDECLKMVKAKFDWSNIVDQFENVIKTNNFREKQTNE
jgi:poly(glycerol-phosphate) alpha-glucosyltransferase